MRNYKPAQVVAVVYKNRGGKDENYEKALKSLAKNTNAKNFGSGYGFINESRDIDYGFNSIGEAQNFITEGNLLGLEDCEFIFRPMVENRPENYVWPNYVIDPTWENNPMRKYYKKHQLGENNEQ